MTTVLMNAAFATYIAASLMSLPIITLCALLLAIAATTSALHDRHHKALHDRHHKA